MLRWPEPIARCWRSWPVEVFSGEDTKPDFNLVEPAGRGGREMEMSIEVLGQPVMVFLVGAVIVEDEVNLLECLSFFGKPMSLMIQ